MPSPTHSALRRLGVHALASALLLLGTVVATSPVASGASLVMAPSAGSWSTTASLVGPNFKTLACPSAKVCYSLGGGGGVIERTHDGGLTWAPEFIAPKIESVQALVCPSVSVCYGFAGPYDSSSAVAIKTTDAGAHWTTKTVPGLGTVSGMACPTLSNCQAVGVAAGGSTASAVRTTDGGKTWAHDKFPPHQQSATSVACASTSTCVVTGANNRDYGYFLYRTTNAGRSWSLITVKAMEPTGRFVSVGCRGSFCLAGGNNAQDYATVWKSTNSGKSWTVIKLPTTMTQTLGDATSIDCASHTTCDLLLNFDGNISVARTTDGGKQWAAEVLPKNVGSISALSCASALTCQAGGAESTAVAQNGTVDVRTSNGGKHWVSEVMPATVGQLATVSCRGTACQAGGLSLVGTLRSTNSGGKWQAQLIGPPSSAGAVQVLDCFSAELCEGIGTYADATSSLRTSNGGKTWTATPLPSGIASTLACSTAQNCVAGLSPMVRTGDGGAKWSAVPLPDASGLYVSSVSCTSRVCMAVADDDTKGWVIMRSSDSGGHWSEKKAPASVGELDLIDCQTASDCVAVGEPPASGGVTVLPCTDGPCSDTAMASSKVPMDIAIRTTNGGTTWSTKPLQVAQSATLSELACPSAQVCELVGGSSLNGDELASAGDITAFALRTGDGGSTWQPQNLPIGAELIDSVSCSTPGHCVAVAYTEPGYAIIMRWG